MFIILCISVSYRENAPVLICGFVRLFVYSCLILRLRKFHCVSHTVNKVSSLQDFSNKKHDKKLCNILQSCTLKTNSTY